MVHRFLLTLGLAVGLALGAAVAPVAAFAATYSAPLNRAIADLSVRAEVRTGYSRFLPTGSTPTATGAARVRCC